MPTEELRVEIRLRDFATRQLKRVQGAFARFATFTANKFRAMGRAITSFRGMLAGLGAGLLAKSFIDAGSAMEKFRIQLNAVFQGNKALAQQTLKWVRDFAAATPFTTKAVIESFVTMKAAGIDATKDMMDTIGNVAFVFDRNISDLSIALVSMEKEVFKRLGVGWDFVGDRARITLGGMVKETAKTRDAMRKGILELWQKQFPGAMQEAEKTWTGLVALLKSEWFEFQADVMESGVFDFVKEGVKVIGTEFRMMAQDPESTADAIIEGMGAIAKAVAAVRDGVTLLKIVFIALGVAVNAVMLGISVALQKMLQGIAGVFSLVQQVLIKVETSGGIVAKGLRKALGEENIGKLRGTLQSLEESVASFAEAGTETVNEYKENIRLATAEIQHLREQSKLEEVTRLFDKIKAAVGVRRELAGLTEEFIRLRTAQAEALKKMDFGAIQNLGPQVSRVVAKFKTFGEAGAEALELARQKANLVAFETKKAADNTEKLAENVKNIDPSGFVMLEKAATAAEGPALDYGAALDMIADKWERIKREAQEAEATYKEIFNAARMKESADALKEWEDNFNAVKGAAMQVGGILVNNIMRSIDQAQQGTFRWKQALMETAQELSKMLLRQALMAAVQFGASALAGAATSPGSVGTGMSQRPALRRGGVVWGGLGLPSAQSGMMVKGPTPLIAGDDRRGTGEIIAPVVRGPNGEIGVQQFGGGGPRMQVQFNVTAIDAKGTEEWLFENRHRLQDMMGVTKQEGRSGRSSF